jgi:predicted RNase H-like HicB family nuclease
MKKFKIIVEKHPDGNVAYPLGLKGVVVGQGDTYEDPIADVRSAIRFHIETVPNHPKIKSSTLRVQIASWRDSTRSLQSVCCS